MTQSDAGIVYVLQNPAMPTFVKIGITSSQNELPNRLRNLFNSSVPLPFTCLAAYEVANYKKVEKALHEAFGNHRINPNREFFEIEPRRVIVLLETFGLRDVTPSTVPVEKEVDSIATEQYVEATERKRNFTFSAVNIPIGSELKFVDDENIVCVVFDDRRVQYDGVVMSLSKAALDVINKKGKNWVAVSGPQMWLYEEETLSERRERLELNMGDTY
jgi:hypothetical protein